MSSSVPTNLLLVDLKTVWRDGTLHLLVMGRAVLRLDGWKLTSIAG